MLEFVDMIWVNIGARLEINELACTSYNLSFCWLFLVNRLSDRFFLLFNFCILSHFKMGSLRCHTLSDLICGCTAIVTERMNKSQILTPDFLHKVRFTYIILYACVRMRNISTPPSRYDTVVTVFELDDKSLSLKLVSTLDCKDPIHMSIKDAWHTNRIYRQPKSYNSFHRWCRVVDNELNPRVIGRPPLRISIFIYQILPYP